MQLKKPAVVLVTASLFALAACGGGGGSSSGGGASDNLTQGSGGGAGKGKDPTATGPVSVPSDATKGGTITILSAQVPSTFDPTQAYYTDSTAIMSLVTRSLTQYVYDPKTKDMVLEPDMATDLGTHNAANTEWTFTLKKGLKYEDGSPVKAADVAYAVKRSFATKELPYGPTYNQTFFLDGDKYKGPFADKGAYKGVVVKGNSVTIKMRRPFSEMDYYASFPQFTAIPQSKDNPQSYGDHPLATGPYKFEDYKAGQSLTLVKNTNWDPKTDPGRIQAVNKWDFQFGQDTAKLENIIVNDNGSAQTTATYDNITPPTYKTMTSSSADKSRITTGTTPCTYLWYLDNRKITNIDVRRAVGYAFPYENYWKAIGEIVGLTRVPGTSLLPPGTAGRVEYDPLGIKGSKTDAAKSKALLKKAGEQNFEIKFYYYTDVPTSVQGKNQIVKGLQAGGFKATPIATTSEKARDLTADPKSPINVRSTGWCSDWPTGGSWFPAQWDGRLIKAGASDDPNPAFFDEASINKGIDNILNNVPASQAAAAWGKLDKTTFEKYYPAVNLGYSGSAIIRGSKIGGFYNDNVRGMPTLADMYIKK